MYLLKALKMRWKLLAIVVGLIFVVTACGLSPSSDVKDEDLTIPSQLTLGATTPGGAFYAIAVAVSEIIQQAHKETGVSILESGARANLIGVEEGSMDLGLTVSAMANQAFQGKGFEKEHTNVAGLLTVFKNPFYIVVRANSDIYKIEDMVGKRIGVGVTGAIHGTVAEEIFKQYGMSFEDMKRVERGGFDQAVMLFRDEHLDVLFKMGPIPDPQIAEIATTIPIRLIELPTEIIAKLNENFNNETQVVPGGTYRGQNEDVLSFGDNAIMIVRNDLPERQVYEITKLIMENKEKLQRVHATMEDFDIERASEGLMVPMHPGARKYFDEVLK